MKKLYSLAIIAATGLCLASCDSDSDPKDPGSEKPEVTVPADAVDLSAKETANCYIVAPGSVAAFSTAFKGNSSELSTGDVAGVRLVWMDKPALITDLQFAANENKAIAWIGDLEGNAVVAAVDAEGTILWSWHLWVTDYDPSADAFTTEPNANGTTWTFMSRNMGALSSTPSDGFATHGMVYQWGRKDPFPAPASYTELNENYEYTPGMDGETTLYDIEGNQLPTIYSTSEGFGSVEKSIANPAIFYAMTYTYTGETDEYGDEIVLNNPLTGDWADTSDDDRWGGVSMKKSIYDPCPPGWKVPVCDATGLTPYDWLTYAKMTWDTQAKGATQDGQWFPACGTRVYASGGCDFSDLNPYAGMWIGTAGKASADLVNYPTLYGQYMFVINGKRTFKVNKDRRSQGMSLRAVRDL